MESIMIDNQSMVNPRRSAGVSRGSLDAARSMNFQYPSMPSLGHELMNMSMDDYNQQLDTYNNASFYGPPIRPLYSSLPPSFSQTSLVPPLHHNFASLQPPLLPLPNSLSSKPAIPSKKMNTTSVLFNGNVNNGYKQGGQRKKMSRFSAVSKLKELQASPSISSSTATKMKLVSKTSSSSEEEFDNGCEGEDESIYSLSPPPSSLPLPSLALMRPRATAGSVACTTEAVNGGGGGANELRRLLRL